MRYPATPPVGLSDDKFAALYPTTPNEELARLANRSVPWVEKKAHALGLKKARRWRNKYMTREDFVAAYSVMSSREIATYCHVAESTVCVWAQKLGLPPRYFEGGTGLVKPRQASRLY